MNDHGIMRDDNVIEYIPKQSIVRLGIGDRTRLTEDEVNRPSAAFFSGLRDRFVEA